MGEKVGRNVIAKIVPFIHRGPQVTGLGVETDSDGIPQSAGEHSHVFAIRIRN